MYMPPKSFFAQLLEGAVMFIIAAFLVKTGILMLADVWVWIIVIIGLILFGRAGWKLYKHYKDTHNF